MSHQTPSHDIATQPMNALSLAAGLQARARRLTQRATWQGHVVRELADAREQLAAAHALIGLYQRSAGITAPAPSGFARAVRTGRLTVEAAIDGQDVVIGLPGEPRLADPVGEAEVWQRHVEVHRRVRHELMVPGGVGLRMADLPEGHRFQAWRTLGLSAAFIVVVSALLPRTAARLALRAALAALRWS